jgi:hypothetical protein
MKGMASKTGDSSALKVALEAMAYMAAIVALFMLSAAAARSATRNWRPERLKEEYWCAKDCTKSGSCAPIRRLYSGWRLPIRKSSATLP